MAKKPDPLGVSKDEDWRNRHFRFSAPFLIFFPIWFTFVLFVGAHLWILAEVTYLREAARAQMNPTALAISDMCAQHPEWTGKGYC